jgi:drug/metabolite transporter (DMT)-like permease
MKTWLYWLCLFACLGGWGIWGICDKQALKAGIHPVMIAVVYSIGGTIIDVILLRSIGQKFAVPAGAWFWLILSIIACTGAFLGYMYLLLRSEASTAVTLTSAYPLVTVILATLFFGEPITLTKVIGAVLTVSGVIILTK